jgi:hypothetical protein
MLNKMDNKNTELLRLAGAALSTSAEFLQDLSRTLEEIKKKIDSTPNDQQLGAELRAFFNEKYHKNEN